MTALVTPFHPDGAIDGDVLAELIDYQLGAGVAAVVVAAGAGEYVSLRPEERVEVVQLAATALRGRAALVAAVLAPDTGSAVAGATAAAAAGAQALLLLTPYYLAPSPAGLVEHVRRVAAAVALPIVLYNNPGRTGLDLNLPVLERLAGLPAVVGVKECERDLGRVAGKIARLGARLAFLSGDDDLLLPFLSLGAPGAIMAGTNLAAPWAVALHRAARQGDWDGARELFYTRLLPFTALYRGPDHPGPLKELLGLAGFPVGAARPPLQPVGEARLAELARALRELGLAAPARA